DRAVIHSRITVRFVPKNIVFETDVLDAFRFQDGKIIQLVTSRRKISERCPSHRIVLRAENCKVGRTLKLTRVIAFDSFV
ncbi:MAG: hypothetical protein L0219_06610, partial [Phycisphaerales bacterium]|nr:hypothetical protein [Phycisphaerales bacterium]